MIAEGATTFWEGYDLSWPKENFHSHLQADNITGYNASLCHGWSAGATSFLTDRILGVRPTSPGFGSVTITPELCDLAWAEGDVPTPQGQIHLRVEKNGGGETIVLRLPAQVNATVIGPGTSISVDGKAVPITRDGGRVSTVIGAAGSYRVAIK